MRLDRITVVVRPRNPWEAIDLGVIMARAWWGPLFKSWLAVSLPVFALLQVALYDYAIVSMLLMWWLKPIWERALLHILSQAFFGEVPSLKQTLRAFPALAFRQGFASLSYRRFSLTRSMDLPVIQLENLKGSERSKRLAVLHRSSTQGASWLTIVGVHIESFLFLAALVLVYQLVPDEAGISGMEFVAGDEPWLQLLQNSVAYACMSVVAPFYVACGFSLYINRRTLLEGWDIEIAFRRLLGRVRSQLAGHLAALFAVCMMLSGGLYTEQVVAQERGEPFDRQTARTAIEQILAGEQFHQQEVIRTPKWLEGRRSESDQSETPPIQSSGKQELTVWLARGFEVLLWAVAFALLAVFAYKYRSWLTQFGAGRKPVFLPQEAQPKTLFGLEVGSESLPDDIIASVNELWRQQYYREVMSLLYRAALAYLMERHGLRFHPGHTEEECMRLVASRTSPELSQYFCELTRHWQRMAYAHQAPSKETVGMLCRRWRVLFPKETPGG